MCDIHIINCGIHTFHRRAMYPYKCFALPLRICDGRWSEAVCRGKKRSRYIHLEKSWRHLWSSDPTTSTSACSENIAAYASDRIACFTQKCRATALSLSLSLSLYIYIYIYIHINMLVWCHGTMCRGERSLNAPQAARGLLFCSFVNCSFFVIIL